MQKLYTNGILLNTSPHAFGELIESKPDFSNISQLREQLKKDGYLHFRNFLNPEKIHNINKSIKIDLARNSDCFNKAKK